MARADWPFRLLAIGPAGQTIVERRLPDDPPAPDDRIQTELLLLDPAGAEIARLDQARPVKPRLRTRP